MCFVPERKKDLGWINPNRDRGFKVKPKVEENRLRFTSTNPTIPKSKNLSSQNKTHSIKTSLGSVNYIFFEKGGDKE